MLNNTESDRICMAAAAMSPAEIEMRDHARNGHRSILKLNKRPCHGCVTAAMRAPAGYKGGGSKERDLESVGGDTVDYKTLDINGHRYGSHWVLLKTMYAKLKMIRLKTASSTAKAFLEAKAHFEALVDPGCINNYKIQRVGRDPGTEFLGEFLDAAAEHNIPRETGAVDIHHCQGIQENRHKMMHRAAIAMCAHCCKHQKDANLMFGNAASWGTELVNHSSITKEQKRLGITAFEQTIANSGRSVTSASILANVPVFGEALYCFVPLKKRPIGVDGKHAWRAIRCLFAGLDPDIDGAVIVIPYERDGDDWALYPALGGILKYIVVQGKFPLQYDEDQEGATLDNKTAWAKIFKAIGAEATAWADQEELQEAIEELRTHVAEDESESESEDTDASSYVPELVLNHGYVQQGDLRVVKFKVKWEGFSRIKDQTWHTMDKLKDSMTLVLDYLEGEGLTIEDVESVPWDESVSAAMAVYSDGTQLLVPSVVSVPVQGAPTEATVDPADSNTYLPEPVEEEIASERVINDHRFAEYLRYDFKSAIEKKIDEAVKASECYCVNGVHLDRAELLRLCDDQYQEQMEQFMAVLDWTGDRTAAGAEEIPLSQWLSDELFDEALAADERELTSMFRLRLRVAKPEELTEYSEKQLKTCLEMRIAHTRKRPTPEKELAGLLGALKSRMVAKDLKVWNKESIADTYAAVPGMIAWRLVIASINLRMRKQSATDYDVAFLQGYTYKEVGMSEVLVRWFDYRKHVWMFGFLEGPAYGQQVCMQIWKLTHGTYLTKALGFKECVNQQSIYRNSELDINIICHVDDPWIDIGLGDQYEGKSQDQIDLELTVKEDALHKALHDRFKTKGKKCLKAGNPPMDYLSMIVETPDDHRIEVSTDPFKRTLLESFDMVGCKPASTPATKALFRDIKQDVEDGNFLDKEGVLYVQKSNGLFNWQSQTIGVDTALYSSLSGKYNANPVEACIPLIKHMVRYVAGTMGQKLKNHPESKNSLVVCSDSDLAGMHSVDGDTRSRGCVVIFYKDMVIDWWSSWIGQMLSSGQAETMALSNALRRAMHVKYLGEELGLRMPRVITVYVDATVAMSFAADVGSPTGMKFIDLRSDWVLAMRDKQLMRTKKVDTRDNPADFGTKIMDPAEFKRQRAYFLDTPKYVREVPAECSALLVLNDLTLSTANKALGSHNFGLLYQG